MSALDSRCGGPGGRDCVRRSRHRQRPRPPIPSSAEPPSRSVARLRRASMVSAQKVAVIGFHDQRARVHLGRGHAAPGAATSCPGSSPSWLVGSKPTLPETPDGSRAAPARARLGPAVTPIHGTRASSSARRDHAASRGRHENVQHILANGDGRWRLKPCRNTRYPHGSSIVPSDFGASVDRPVPILYRKRRISVAQTLSEYRIQLDVEQIERIFPTCSKIACTRPMASAR